VTKDVSRYYFPIAQARGIVQSLALALKYLLSATFLKDFVVVAYKIKGGCVAVKVRGQSVLIAVDHWRTLKRAKTYSVKEPDTLDWLDNFEPNTCYFDIGANIGQYSLYPAKKYGQAIKIYAFEPQSSNYYSLNKNIVLNKLGTVITAYCVAISKHSEFSTLHIPKFIPGGNRSQFATKNITHLKASPAHIQGMLGVTLDDLCLKWGFPFPNYIKIDVDGIEIAILEGAKNVLNSPVLHSVIVELGTREEQKQAKKLMQQAGFMIKHQSTRNWGETCFIFERVEPLTNT